MRFVPSLSINQLILKSINQVDHFVDSNDVGSISEHGSSSDSESEVERRPLRDGESGHRERADNRSSIPYSRTATFKAEELEREV